MNRMPITIEDVKRNLKRFDSRTSDKTWEVPAIFRKASVLVPLFFKFGEPHVLLTVRREHLNSHPGHVAFPGGRHEDEDSDEVHTALREAKEEIGLDPETVDIIAVLPPTFVRPDHSVTPIIGMIPNDFRPIRNCNEVSFVFDLPLSRFLRDDLIKSHYSFSGHSTVVYFFHDDIDGRHVTVWGFTAVYCVQVALVALQSNQTVEGLDGGIIDRKNAFSHGIQYLKYAFDSISDASMSKL